MTPQTNPIANIHATEASAWPKAVAPRWRLTAATSNLLSIISESVTPPTRPKDHHGNVGRFGEP
jgi:hypothetical protein